MGKITLSDLHARQAWPLEQKIDHTVGAIDAFLAYCREHGRSPYVSFSGGLNSTVLLHLARRVFGADLKGVFCSTGNEFPEIVRFVRRTPNVEIIHPALTPRQVMERYGFPLVSKEQAQAVRQIRTTESEKLRNYRLYGDGVRRAGVLSGALALPGRRTLYDLREVLRDIEETPVSSLQHGDPKSCDGGHDGQGKQATAIAVHPPRGLQRFRRRSEESP